MPRIATSLSFDRQLAKLVKKDKTIIDAVVDAFEKFQKNSVPTSLDFKPIAGTSNLFSIRTPKRKGWRILMRKLREESEILYEAYAYGNHDIRRQGN